MNVVDYLRKFLNEQPGREAAVPGLGVFYTEQRDGRNKILFKEVMPTDKAFLNFFAFEENLNEEDARTELEKWVRKVLQELKGTGKVTIAEVGTFVIVDDKVLFKSASEEPVNADNANFGLEQPAPQTVLPELPKEERPLRPPVPVEKARGKHAPRPIGKPKLQPAAQPASSGKEIVLGSRKRPAPQAPLPVYARTWFILLCVLAVLLAVILGVAPVRKALFGLGEKPALEMQLPADDMVEAAVDQMMEDELESTVMEEENAQVAQAVMAGEVKRKEQEAQAKKMQAASQAAPKAAAKPAPAPKKEAVKKVESASGRKVDAKRPQAGKFYLIVGSFASEANAGRMAQNMCANGLAATIYYIEAKNLFYVSVKTCATREEAVGERTALRNRNIDCWIFAN
ncbi:MAG: SPOR domain-containing protein [Bacteroidales bacterium]|nr:SPOR domain-containing protein [Bacteroidales bacterium]MDE7073143.1 SPOR domain-containing protein [Bacteroidales bacterium]